MTEPRRAQSLWTPLAGAAALAVLTVIWCGTLPHGILMGDDLSLVVAVRRGTLTPWSSLVDPGTWSKYRPVTDFVFTMVIPVFGNRFWLYETLNIVLQCVNALLVASIALRLTRGNRTLAFCAGTAFAVSRFAYYQILQAIGLFEAIGLLFALLAIRSVVRAYQERNIDVLLRSLLWAVLATLSDERYLALAPFLVVAGIAFPDVRRRNARAALLSVGGVLLVGLYYALKTVVFRSAFVTATSGQAVNSNTGAVAGFFRDALLNVFNFNVGPAYLSGGDLSQFGSAGYVAGAVVALPATVVLVWYAISYVRTHPADGTRCVAMGVSLFLPLLATACVSYRLEFRWLYAAFTVLVLCVVGAAGNVFADGRRLRTGTIVATVLVALTSLYYRQYIHNVYFVYEMEWGRIIRGTLASDQAARAIVVTHGDTGIERWTFEDQTFLDEYDLGAVEASYVDEPPPSYGTAYADADVFEKVGIDLQTTHRARRGLGLSARDGGGVTPDLAPPTLITGFPSGTVRPGGDEPQGIYHGGGDATCCWVGPDVRFSVDVPPGSTHRLAVTMYVPKSGPFAKSDQVVTLVSPKGTIVASAHVPAGVLSTVTLAIPSRQPAAPTIHLHFARSFVPHDLGESADVRRLAVILEKVTVQ